MCAGEGALLFYHHRIRSVSAGSTNCRVFREEKLSLISMYASLYYIFIYIIVQSLWIGVHNIVGKSRCTPYV